MKKTHWVVILIALCFATTSVLAHYPTTLTVNAAQKKQAPVTFNHALHGDKLAKNCQVCHHTEKTLTKEVALANKVEIKKCSACHLDPKDAKVPSMREMSAAKNPMHIRCIACHKSEKKGPVACTACHVKKS